MKISERIKRWFRREPPTAEDLAARAEAASMRDQLRRDESALQNQGAARLPGQRWPALSRCIPRRGAT